MGKIPRRDSKFYFVENKSSLLFWRHFFEIVRNTRYAPADSTTHTMKHALLCLRANTESSAVVVAEGD